MNLVFKKLVVENFLSFGYAELEFKDGGVIFVRGVNKNPVDRATSNGSGKSAIWDAISWVLTGTTIRGVSKEVVNSHTDGGCCVQLQFSVDSVSYDIFRYKDHKTYGNNIKFFVNEQDVSGKGIRDTEKIVQSYLPELNNSLIGSVIILGQGLPQRFSNNTPSGRKDVLETLSKSDFMINDIKQKLSRRKDSLNVEIRETQDAQLKLNTENKFLTSELEKTQNKLNDIEPVDFSRISQIETELQDAENILNSTHQECNIKKTKVQSLNSSIYYYQSECSRERSDIKDSYKVRLDELTRAKTTAELEVSSIKKEIVKAQSIKEFCPTCGQRLPEVHKPNIEPLQQDVRVKEEELNQLSSQYSKTVQDMNEALAQVDNKYNTIITNVKNELEIENENLCQIEVLLTQHSNKVRELSVLLETTKAKSNMSEQMKEQLLSTIKELKEKLHNVNDDILYYNTKETSLKLHIETVNKMLTIATRDFRGYLLKNVIDYINNRAKRYSNDVFDTDRIDFYLEGNNINISYDNKLYENLSSGERVKCDIIIQLSLRDMLCTFNNFSSNILVLDEVFDGLDALGCERVIDLITNKLHDIESVFIVSHRSDLPITYDRELIIEKDSSGISKICKI